MGEILPLFARQPIFNNDLEVVAYELLFRGGLDNFAAPIDGDQATSHVLLYAFGQHRIEEIIGDVPAYINFTRQLLVFPPPLPPEKLVIEILEDVKPDKHILQSLSQLKEQGYQIALDDFFINRDTKVLVSFANTIKIDVLALTPEKLEKYVKYLKPLGVKLLAEKVETHEMMQHCKQLGFDFYQGYFLCKPQIIKGLKMTESKQSVLRLLATLTSPDTDIKAIVNAIASDPRLSYRILKIVNSSACNAKYEINSLNQAVSMLGINHIRNWATFLALANDESKPPELCVLGMTRAKFCELIGERFGGKVLAESSFTAGLLSTFDAFLDLPIEELLKSLNLSSDISKALLQREGDIGVILEISRQIERANWSALKQYKEQAVFKLSDTELNNFYADALCWAQSVVNTAH